MDFNQENIVLILGNGFDLAVGRRTTYKDFYKSKYCPVDYPAPLIKFLNGRWDENDLENVRWLDMENALQEYAQNPPQDDYYTKDEGEAVSRYYSVNATINPYFNFENIPDRGPFSETENFLMIISKLIREKRLQDKNKDFDKFLKNYGEYFSKKRLTRDREALSKIKEGLSSYLKEEGEKISRTSDKKAISLLSYYLNYTNGNSSIYSFNYTSIDDLIEGEKGKNYNKKIHYMHGSLKDNHVIIGTKDGTYDKYDFLQKAFDKKYNPPSLLNDMQWAHRIDIYGHSLGDCDSQYFGYFFESVITGNLPTNKKKTINIYTYDDDSEILIKKNLNILTKNKLSYLYAQCNLHFIKSKEE